MVLAIGANTATSTGTSFNSGNNAESAWQELTASTSTEIDGFTVIAVNASGNNARLDIGIGAASSETVLVPDLMVCGRTAHPVQTWHIPIRIASGTRVSARASGVGAVVTVRVMLEGWNTGTSPTLTRYTSMTAIGYASSTGMGTAITAHLSANTKGSWTQLIASTAEAYDALMVCVQNDNNFVRSTRAWLLDIGTGAASSETVIIPDIYCGEEDQLDLMYPLGGIGPFAVDIPSGTRIAARCQGSTGNTGFSLAVYGFAGGVASTTTVTNPPRLRV